MTNKYFFILHDKEDFSVHEVSPYEYILILMKKHKRMTFNELKEISKIHKSTLHLHLQKLRKYKYLIIEREYPKNVGRPKLLYVWNDDIEIPTIDELLEGVI